MLAGGPAVARALTARGTPATWGNAEEVPGIAALNQGGDAEVTSLSCASPGTCSVGGYYTDADTDTQAFIADETNGVWGSAEEVPGTAQLNTYGAEVLSVSCVSAGNCSAGGYYTTSNEDSQAFIVNQSDGVWGQAVEVPGSQVLNTGGGADVSAVSCVRSGACIAAGDYLERSGNLGEFVVAGQNGNWGEAQKIQGLAGLYAQNPAGLYTLSCASAGNCAAGGQYPNAVATGQTFVVSSKDGTWGTAEKLAGTTRSAAVFSLSCTAAGSCIGGGETGGNNEDEGLPFMVKEHNGTWSHAQQVPGLAVLDTGDGGDVNSVSCASTGNCGLGGDYFASNGGQESFVATEEKGVWGNAEEVPGTAGLNNQGSGQTVAVSCTSPGDCSAGGDYAGNGVGREVYVDTETNGVWAQAEEVPGIATLNTSKAAFMVAVSCSAPGQCGAAGTFVTKGFAGETEPFVVTES